MPNRKDLPRDVGGFIRDLRHNARISLRQLADQAGVSNPYLSQIERGLRKPSAEVLQQLASALRVSAPMLYLRAGLLEADGQGVLAAIAGDPDLSVAQKQSLSQIYETFRRENTRQAAETESAAAGAGAATQTPGPGTPADGVLESVAVTEAGGAPAPTAKPSAESVSAESVPAASGPAGSALVEEPDAAPTTQTSPLPAKTVARKATRKAADPVAEEEK